MKPGSQIVLTIFLLVVALGITLLVLDQQEVEQDVSPQPENQQVIQEVVEQQVTEQDQTPTQEVEQETPPQLPPSPPGTVTIEIKDLRFIPDTVTITPGTKVIWINTESKPHLIVAYDRSFRGVRMQEGDTFNKTFNEIGEFTYLDAVFPKIGRGKIIVQNEPLPITGSFIGIQSASYNQQYTILAIAIVVFIIAICVIIRNKEQY